MARRKVAEKIKNMTSEVNELHPLLEQVFSNMPTITNVSNTHGSGEMGADFILTKISEELGDTEYIGVIVKVGKILQNHTELERQIDECKLPRITANARKEISITEIWVACNNTISELAKKKLLYAYANHKIKFIDINKLAELVEKYFPNFNSELTVSEVKILDRERIRASERDASMSLLPEAEARIYIDQEIEKIDYDDYREATRKSKGREVVNIFNEIETNKITTIEAQMGGGKSRLINKIVSYFSDQEIFIEKGILPIYLHSKDIESPQFCGLKGMVERLELENELKGENRRRFLFLIDGLDESDFGDSESVSPIDLIINDVKSSDNIQVVFATRKISDEMLEQKIQKNSKRYEIRPLSIKKVFVFIESICKYVKVEGRLIEDLKNSSLFKVLPRTPIAAIILAKIMQQKHEELPSNLTELYSQYIELSLGRWDLKKGLTGHMEYEALVAIMSRLAAYYMENQVHALSIGEVKEIFDTYLKKRNFEFNADHLLSLVLDRCDILSINNAYGTVSFRHKSFCEFFYAKFLMTKPNIDLTPSIFSQYWVNSYYFYIGLRKDCPELLDAIIELEDDSEGFRFSKLTNLGNFLLAGYSSPYEVVERGISKTFSSAAEYFEDISTNKINSPFNTFPRIHVLAFFRFMLSQSYSFPFFKPAVETALEEVFTASNKSEADAYKLFFLDIALAELGGTRLFDRLIEAYDRELPLILQLAVKHEAEHQKQTSTLIKALEKRLTKNIRISKQYRDAVKSLYKINTVTALPRSQVGKKQIATGK